MSAQVLLQRSVILPLPRKYTENLMLLTDTLYHFSKRCRNFLTVEDSTFGPLSVAVLKSTLYGTIVRIF